MSSGLTITIIFEAESANYGEGIGNITTLKKMSRSDGKMYSYISRQAIRYNIVNQMGYDDTPVNKNEKTLQFDPEATIKDYPEIDMFGYMRTRAKSDNDIGGADTRSAAVRLSNAISLEPYNNDLDFLTNMGLAHRIKDMQNNIAQSEIHRSLYSYTICVDLDRIGEDEGISLPSSEKGDRVSKLLNTIQFLYRDIKGRRENLSPLFVIGGVYDRKSPYFEGRCKLKKDKLNVDALKSIITSCEDTSENTVVGYLDGSFTNEDEIKEKLCKLNGKPILMTVQEAFKALDKKVREFYNA